MIYFSLEDTFNRLQNRIFQLIDGGDAPERLILQTECPSIGQGLEEQVEALVHTYHDVGLIVIDTLQKVRLSDGNGGMYANDYKETGSLKKLADKYGICILLIHHLRKQSASDPFDQISGSTGLMGVADTSWVMQRKRMSQTADILLTGRDMDDRTLHLREEHCVWTLEDEETAEEREIKAVPDYLWKAAEYIESVGNWQGTASELLAAAGIEDAKPNQFTYNMVKYFDRVFEPKGIRYKTHRKNKVRLLNFYGDDGDGGDDDGPRLYELKHPPRQNTPKRYRPKDTYAGKGILEIFLDVFFGESQMHRLYLYYCYQLGILPKKQQPRINRPELERIWKDTERILAEHAFVKDHRFTSLQAIVDYRKGLSQQMDCRTPQRGQNCRGGNQTHSTHTRIKSH